MVREGAEPEVNRILYLLFCFLALVWPSYGHESAKMHVDDIVTVFNGYGDEAFIKLSEDISSGIDYGLPSAFRAEIGPVPGNHRILGHGWTLNDSIPEETLQELEQRYPGKSGDIRKVWRQFAKNIIDESIALTGLPKTQAAALAAIIYDIHLLGDYEPDNKLVERVLKPKEIANNIIKDCQDLFKNKPQLAKIVEEALNRVLEENAQADSKILAQKLMDEMMTLQFGDKLSQAWGKTLKPQYTEACAEAAKAKYATRMTARIAQCEEELVVARKAPLAPAQYGKLVGNRLRVPGLLLPNGKILVLAKSFAKTAAHLATCDGVFAFAVEGGIATYQYYDRSIGSGEMEEKLIEAAVKGAVIQACTAVTIEISLMYESAAGGPITMLIVAVGIAAYEVTDLAIKILKAPHVTPEDLKAFDITLNSVAEMQSDTPLLLPYDTPLELPNDTVMEIDLNTVLNVKP